MNFAFSGGGTVSPGPNATRHCHPGKTCALLAECNSSSLADMRRDVGACCGDTESSSLAMACSCVCRWVSALSPKCAIGECALRGSTQRRVRLSISPMPEVRSTWRRLFCITASQAQQAEQLLGIGHNIGAEVQLAVCLVCAVSIAQRVAAQDNALVTHASLLQFQVVGIVLRHPRFSPLEPLGLLGRTCDGRTRQLQPGQLVLRQDLGELVQGACN